MGSIAAGASRSGVDTLRKSRPGQGMHGMPPSCTTLTSISLPAAHSPVVILRPTNGNRDDAHQLAESRALQDQNASSTSYLLPNLRTAFSDEKPGIELRTGVVRALCTAQCTACDLFESSSNTRRSESA